MVAFEKLKELVNGTRVTPRCHKNQDKKFFKLFNINA